MVEAARNVACTGAEPRAVTDGLNFGNPTYPHVYWQFSEAVKGIADAAETMHTPVISGNVSFYNESDLGEVPPTPLIGMLGVLDDASKRVGIAPKEAGQLIILSTIPATDLEFMGVGASSYLAVIHGLETGYPEQPDVEAEKWLCMALNKGISEGTILSAHDLSDGGLAVAAAEIVLAGAPVQIASVPHHSVRNDANLFGEVPGRVLVTAQSVTAIQELAAEYGLQAYPVGHIGHGEGLAIHIGDQTIRWTKDELENAFEGAIPNVMAGA